LSPAVTVHEHDVDYVEAGNLARRFANERGLFLEGGFFNLFRREGLKTAYLEAAVQMDFEVDLVFQAVSSGIGFYGGYNAFRQLKSAGYIKKMPRFICVQQDTCAPMVSAFHHGREMIEPQDVIKNPVGLAQAILRGDPTVTYPYILGVVRESGGTFVAPSQADIVSSFEALNRGGMTACHTSATVLAAWRNLVETRTIAGTDRALLMLTGGHHE
jgi:threonine synthase